MTKDVIDYEPKPSARRRPVAGRWREARFGMLSMGAFTVTVTGYVGVGCVGCLGCLGARAAGDVVSTYSLCSIGMTFAGLTLGVLGTDFDRDRSLGYTGLFLNATAFVLGCVLFPFIAMATS